MDLAPSCAARVTRFRAQIVCAAVAGVLNFFGYHHIPQFHRCFQGSCEARHDTKRIFFGDDRFRCVLRVCCSYSSGYKIYCGAADLRAAGFDAADGYRFERAQITPRSEFGLHGVGD